MLLVNLELVCGSLLVDAGVEVDAARPEEVIREETDEREEEHPSVGVSGEVKHEEGGLGCGSLILVSVATPEAMGSGLPELYAVMTVVLSQAQFDL